VNLRTLGAAAAFRADGSRIEGLTPESKRFAVLLRIALAGSCRRDELAVMLWPDLDQEHARGALRQSLRYLRQAIGSGTILNRGDEELALAPGEVCCDAAEFERAIGEGRAWDAWELYGGDFLETVYVSGASPEFADWMDAQRLRLRRLASRTAWRLADDIVASGDIPRGTDFARRACLLAGDSETDVARLLALLAATGDRAGALAEYGQFASHLVREYEAEPSPQTQTLIATIRAQTVAAPVAGSASLGNLTSSRVDASRLPAQLTLADETLDPAPTVPHSVVNIPPASRSRLSRWNVGALFVTTLLALSVAAYALRHDGRSAFASNERGTPTASNVARRQALELTVRGEYYMSTRKGSDALRARDLYEDAIDKDPTLTRAYVGLAYAYGLFAHSAMMPSHEAFRLSAAAASKALALDSTSGMAIAQLSAAKAFDEWRWAEAESGYRQAIAGEPGNADLHVLYGTYLRVLGRYAESAREFHRAHELEPLVRHFSNQEVRVLLCAGQTDSALALLMPAIALGERSSAAHRLAADAFGALHRYDDALHESQVAAQIDGDSANAAALGQLHFITGYTTMRRAEATAGLSAVEARARREWVSPAERAAAYAQVGDAQTAYGLLDSAVKSRDVMVTKIGCNSSFDGMRAEPRFLSIARRVGVSAGSAKTAVGAARRGTP
jgi:DNA-binding SARP family transcriptional activator/Tfp pilus assembly protein PilF